MKKRASDSTGLGVLMVDVKQAAAIAISEYPQCGNS